MMKHNQLLKFKNNCSVYQFTGDGFTALLSDNNNGKLAL